ncbi:uncharacterized protein DUF4944 [Natranaerovirga hydrolytica]|uniref:Uncharacterized protein DUF4944 n=1 Tax=Natranaerovirga hydrolytica TaxID=680378 RepID=A0A4V2Q1Q8_9FIRM|nr:DUF4944 domain-containing protein [Natranaerovirga hydrolytica]TCK98621.1 uncharacterized protein DUF4944 [Natranaerovirga hydrolytica]
MSNKIKVIIGIIIFLGLVSLLHGLMRAPIWVGTTEDGEWKIVYEKISVIAPAEWEGSLYWQGDEEVFVENYGLYINNKFIETITSQDIPQLEDSSNLSLVDYCFGRQINSTDKLTVNLTWIEDESVKVEKIDLKMKRRYIPFY